MNDPRSALTSALMPTPPAPNMNLPPATSFAGAAQNAGLPPLQDPGGPPPPPITGAPPPAPNMNLPPATSFADAAQHAGLPPMQAPGGGPPPLPSDMNFAPTNLSPDQALAALKTQGLPTAPVTSLAGAQQNAGLPQMQAPSSPMPLARIGRGF